MDIRELSGLASPETSDMFGAPNSYGNRAGVASHSMAVANSTGMRLSETSMFSSTPMPLDDLGTIYTGDSGQEMRQTNMFNLIEPMKKKRGRPRKYDPDQNMALSLCHSSSKSDYTKSLSEPTPKRRGRPPGSRKKQQLDALGTCGTAFTPHVITVNAGEDVASQIMAFSRQGPRTICILSANGTISSVTLRRSVASGISAAYEDQFEIISLKGSYLPKDDEGNCLRIGSLSVALAGSNGHVVAGEVGRLMAASPVQVVVGSFMVHDKKKPKHNPPSAPILGFQANSSAMSPLPPRGSLSGSDEEERRTHADRSDPGHLLLGGLNPGLESFN